MPPDNGFGERLQPNRSVLFSSIYPTCGAWPGQVLLERQLCPVRPRKDPEQKMGTTRRPPGPTPLRPWPGWGHLGRTNAAESISSPVDLTAFFLDDGTVGDPTRPQPFLVGFQRGLDGRGPQSANTSQPNLDPWTAIRPEPRQDGRFDTTSASLFWVLLSAPLDFCLRKLQEKLDRAERLMTQLVRLQSPATALVLLRFCLGWCQISPPSSLSSVPQSADVPSRTGLGGIIQVAITQEAWLQAQASTKERRFRHQRPRSPLSPNSWPRAAAQLPLPADFGPNATTLLTPTCPLPRGNSAATSEKMRLGGQMAR